MSDYFSKPYEHFRGNKKVELNPSNYAPKSELKLAKGANTTNLAKKSDLASLKSEVNKIDSNKLEIVPTNISKLSHEVI